MFIFNIGSTLTTASASAVALINGAQGGNVFWRIGSSATLGTTTSFAGDILAQASITLNTGASITCGGAWARAGAVTLDSNAISICPMAAGTGPPLGPTGVPLLAFLLPPSATADERAVANAIDAFIGAGGTLPMAFLNLFNLAPPDLANALAQLSGEAATGAQQSGFQTMSSFLALMTNPFADNRNPPETPPSRAPIFYKAPFYKAAAGAPSDARRWSIWAAAYGGEGTNNGDPSGVGGNKLTTRRAALPPASTIGSRPTRWSASRSRAAAPRGRWRPDWAAGARTSSRPVSMACSAMARPIFRRRSRYAAYWASTSRTVTVLGSRHAERIL